MDYPKIMAPHSLPSQRKTIEALRRILQDTAYSKLVFLIFSGKNCYVCQKLHQHLPWFAETHRNQIDVIVVDARNHTTLAAEHAINNIPTVMVYQKGVRISRDVGVGSREKLQEILRSAVQT